MYKGTTPTFIFTFEDFDPTIADRILLTFSVDKKRPILELDESDMTVSSVSISVYLPQETTLSFPNGQIYAQFNFVFSEGQRVASEIVAINWARNLHNEVIT